ncbi:hypothetical protein Tco_1079566 [Tanacetum coccineum]|uniref:Uncharacterized protein n=1 Tax=Tanacetum coccineum TaxID=301880 RepID=A0ABQ5HS75_9ASTR
MTTNTASSSSAFGGHSESWHSAAALGDYSNGPPSQFPSLLLAEKEECMVRITLHYSPSNKSIARFRLPEEMVRRITRQRDFYFVIDMKDKCVKREGFGMMPIFYNKAKWRWRDMGFTSGLIGNHSSLTHGNRVAFTPHICVSLNFLQFLVVRYDCFDVVVGGCGGELVLGERGERICGDVDNLWKIEKLRSGLMKAHTIRSALSCAKGLLLECKPEEAAAIIQVVIQVYITRHKRPDIMAELEKLVSEWPLELIKCRKDEDKTALAGGLQEDIPTMIDSLSGLGVKLNYVVDTRGKWEFGNENENGNVRQEGVCKHKALD